jgi:hypothetical protein
VHNPAAESTIDYGDESDIGDVFMDFDYSNIAADAAQGGGKSYADLQEALYDIIDSGMTPRHCGCKAQQQGRSCSEKSTTSPGSLFRTRRMILTGQKTS